MNDRYEDRENRALRGEPISRRGRSKSCRRFRLFITVPRSLATDYIKRLQYTGDHHSPGAELPLVLAGIGAFNLVTVLALRARSDRVGLELPFDRGRGHAFFLPRGKAPPFRRRAARPSRCSISLRYRRPASSIVRSRRAPRCPRRSRIAKCRLSV